MERSEYELIKYSVIIPIYNAEKTIHRCIDSLLGQDCSDAEIILVNDGSPDRSGEICRAYARAHPEIRLIEKENGGVSTARNAGLDAARGKYVCFVDSDDYVSPSYFSEIGRALSDGRWDLIRFSYCVDDGICVQERRSAGFSAETRKDALPKLLDDICRKTLNSPWAKVYRKELIDRHQIRFPVGASMAEDRAFNISYSLHVNSYQVSDQALYYVNTQNDDSLSRKQHEDLALQFQIADGHLTEAIEKAGISEEEKEAYRRAVNFGVCRGVYRDAKELHRNGVGWLARLRALRKCCAEINRQKMRYPGTRYCRLITLPVRLNLTPVIDLIAWKLTH